MKVKGVNSSYTVEISKHKNTVFVIIGDVDREMIGVTISEEDWKKLKEGV